MFILISGFQNTQYLSDPEPEFDNFQFVEFLFSRTFGLKHFVLVTCSYCSFIVNNDVSVITSLNGSAKLIH